MARKSPAPKKSHGAVVPPAGLPADAIGFIARREAGAGERWALYRADGTLSNTFAMDEDRAAVAAVLARGGLMLRDDNSVGPAA